MNKTQVEILAEQYQPIRHKALDHTDADIQKAYIAGYQAHQQEMQQRVAIVKAWIAENRPKLAGLGALNSLLNNLVEGELPQMYTEEDIHQAWSAGNINGSGLVGMKYETWLEEYKANE